MHRFVPHSLAVQTVAEAFPPALLTSRLLPAILAFARDPVPNVRFNLAKALQRLATLGVLDTAAAARIRPILTALAADTDDDVRFYAGKASAALTSA